MAFETLLPSGAENYTAKTLMTSGLGLIDLMISFAIGSSIIAILWGAIQYFIGGVDKESKAANGKKIVMWAIIGLMVMMLSRVILRQILIIIQPATIDDITPDLKLEDIKP